MARRLLIVCAIYACGLGSADAQISTDPQNPPAARLIQPKAGRTEPHLAERPRSRLGQLDERCRPLKDQLEAALQKPGNAHRLFQARLAHNAGTRLCREGRSEKGLAEFQKGLSYLQK